VLENGDVDANIGCGQMYKNVSSMSAMSYFSNEVIWENEAFLNLFAFGYTPGEPLRMSSESRNGACCGKNTVERRLRNSNNGSGYPVQRKMSRQNGAVNLKEALLQDEQTFV